MNKSPGRRANNARIFCDVFRKSKIFFGLTFEYVFCKVVNMFPFSKNRNESEYDKKLIKCKKCEMKFDNKDRLLIHNKKAHSGRGERKKKT
jgi:hypothetical protein